VSRRGRAVGFASAAAVCAGLAAATTGGAPAGGAAQYGPLREVVVAVRPLPARRPLGREAVAEDLEIRRVPESFVPPDALMRPAAALGRRPATPIPAGGYLLASQFARPRAAGTRRGEPRLAAGRRPVEISVEGAGALASGAGTEPARVDVVVTTEPTAGAGPGRTFVAAKGVRLLELRALSGEPEPDPLAPPGSEAWVATLALTRAQALRLIHAQSFAREVRLIGA
jgi:Flp pilus assembly protein CpaB